MHSRIFIALFVSFAVFGCTSATPDGVEVPPASHGTLSDLEYIDTLTDYDERGTLDVISWAHFEARSEFKAYTEELIKEHRARTASLLAWRKEHFPNEAQRRLTAPSCIGESLRVEKGEAGTYDLRLLEALIRHRRCSIELSNRVLADSRDPEVIKIARGVVEAFTKQIGTLEQWRQQWGTR